MAVAGRRRRRCRRWSLVCAGVSLLLSSSHRWRWTVVAFFGCRLRQPPTIHCPLLVQSLRPAGRVAVVVVARDSCFCRCHVGVVVVEGASVVCGMVRDP